MDDMAPKETALKVKHHPQNTIATSRRHTIGLKANGTVVATGENGYGRCDVDGWHAHSFANFAISCLCNSIDASKYRIRNSSCSTE